VERVPRQAPSCGTSFPTVSTPERRTASRTDEVSPRGSSWPRRPELFVRRCPAQIWREMDGRTTRTGPLSSTAEPRLTCILLSVASSSLMPAKAKEPFT